MKEEFYVGYAAKAPDALGRKLRVVVICLLTGSVAVAALLSMSQLPFPLSKFEFQRYRQHQGNIIGKPYPLLISDTGPFLLVAPGKHGADHLVDGRTGTSLQGALIERDGMRTLEIIPESMQSMDMPPLRNESQQLGNATLIGTIVDTKCYMGVMNPGEGKVHRDCAARCISGGIPPGFLVKDALGKAKVLLLSAEEHKPIRELAAKFAGEPITLSGRLIRSAKLLFFEVGPEAFPRE